MGSLPVTEKEASMDQLVPEGCWTWACTGVESQFWTGEGGCRGEFLVFNKWATSQHQKKRSKPKSATVIVKKYTNLQSVLGASLISARVEFVCCGVLLVCRLLVWFAEAEMTPRIWKIPRSQIEAIKSTRPSEARQMRCFRGNSVGFAREATSKPYSQVIPKVKLIKNCILWVLAWAECAISNIPRTARTRTGCCK